MSSTDTIVSQLVRRDYTATELSTGFRTTSVLHSCYRYTTVSSFGTAHSCSTDLSQVDKEYSKVEQDHLFLLHIVSIDLPGAIRGLIVHFHRTFRARTVHTRTVVIELHRTTLPVVQRHRTRRHLPRIQFSGLSFLQRRHVGDRSARNMDRLRHSIERMTRELFHRTIGLFREPQGNDHRLHMLFHVLVVRTTVRQVILGHVRRMFMRFASSTHHKVSRRELGVGGVATRPRTTSVASVTNGLAQRRVRIGRRGASVSSLGPVGS